MGSTKRPPVGSTPDPRGKGKVRGRNDRASAAAQRKRDAPSPSADSAPSQQSRPPPSEDEEEQEDQLEGSISTEDAREGPEEEVASPPRHAKHKARQHTGVIKAGRRHSRGHDSARSRSAPQRKCKRDSGAAASGSRDAPFGAPRDAAKPHLPRPPLAPPPPSIRRSVTLQAKAETEEPPTPPPPPGPTPDEYLRMAIEFRTSLDDLEHTCAGVRGTLGSIKYILDTHIMNLRNEFKMAC